LRKSELKKIGIRKPQEYISELSEAKPRDIANICVICVKSKNAAKINARIKEKDEIPKKLLILFA
jgi:hypothetical protein